MSRRQNDFNTALEQVKKFQITEPSCPEGLLTENKNHNSPLTDLFGAESFSPDKLLELPENTKNALIEGWFIKQDSAKKLRTTR